MFPILVEVGPITLYTYGVLLAVAFLVATWRAGVVARLWPVTPVPVAADQVVNLCTAIMVGGLIGARAFFVFSNLSFFALYPFEVFAIWHGGLVWYGGLVGGLMSGAWSLRAKGLPPLRALDQLVPFVALGHAIGRIGCFFNGCCYGKPTAAWFGVTFPGYPHPLVPTQLIESAVLVLLYAGLRRLQRPSVLRRPGLLCSTYLLAYAACRFLIEFWRGDQHLFVLALTLQQVISLALGLIALIGLVGMIIKWRGRIGCS